MAVLPALIAISPSTKSVPTMNVFKEQAVVALKVQIVLTVKAAVITSAK